MRLVAALARPGPWILPDELLYVDLARSLADGGLPAVRGVTSLGWGVVYPVLVAPAWLLFDDPLVAYRAALALNALVMSLAAIPGYLLARLFVGHRLALLVAGGTVLVPAMALTGSVMTENAAYPLFLGALWLVARAVRSPSTTGQVAALAAIGLLTVTRAQGVILLPVAIAATCIFALTLPAVVRRAYLARYRLAALVLAGAAALALAVAIASDGGLASFLGGRSSAAAAIALDEVPRLLGLQAGDLLLTVAVIPAVASAVMIVVGLSRGAPEAQRLFAAVAASTLAGVLALVALVGSSIDSEGAEGVNARYTFYLVPVLLVGFAAWLETAPRRAWLGPLLVVGAAVLVGLLPFDDLAADATFYAPALVPWVALPTHVAPVAAVVATLGLGLVWLRFGARGARFVAGVTAVWLAGVALVASFAHQHHATTAAALSGGGEPTWVDDSLPAGEAVQALWDQRPTSSVAPAPGYFPLMVTAVLNHSVTRTLRLGPSTYYENVLPTIPVTAGRDGVLVDAARQSVPGRFVLVPCSLAIEGQPVARSADGRLSLVRTDGAVRLVEASTCRSGG